jgi:hypothetical protein
VCGETDARALVDVALAGGEQTVVCGSHALMYRRLGMLVRSEAELRSLLRERRGRRDRRHEADELGAALAAAFHAERRAAERRRNT